KSKGDSSESKPAESKESAPAAAPASGESKPSGKCGSGCGCH
ncbi:MAG: FmdB family transcriptional regulator, partial [Proteobacteria bacterium]